MTTSESHVKKKDRTSVEFFVRHLTGHREGLVERFHTDRVAIGRGKNNHCSFDAEKERSVSHRHCEIRIEEGIAIIYDIGSLNGTYVNGRRVRRAPLTEGDEIGLGREGPRLRFGLGDGKDQPPPANPIDKPKPRIGATAEEPQPLAPHKQVSPDAWRRAGLLLIGAAILGLVGSVGWFVTGLLDRIKSLETGEIPSTTASGTPAPHEPSRGSIDRAPTAIPSGPRGAVARLVGAIRDERGRLIEQRDLGFGAVAHTSGIVTTNDVLRRIEWWLGHAAIDARHSKSVLAAPNGAMHGAAGVAMFIRHPDAGRREDCNLALLLLEEGTRLARVATATPKPGVARVYAPWEKARDLPLIRLTDNQRGRVPAERATLIAFETTSGVPAPDAGMPLFIGDELVGVSLGTDLVGWAVSSVAIKRLLDHAERAEPSLLAPKGK